MPVDHYENFPVASWLCPPVLRPAVASIYWFARTADDLADEGDVGPAARLADLAAYRRDLEATLSGRASGARWASVFGPLRRAIETHRLPPALLHALLDAFEQDVHNPPYPDRPALLDYCSRSANPVGRLLLHLHGERDPQRLAQSDAICSALQLINFWQDLGRDQQRGRSYLPQTDLAQHGLAAPWPLRIGDSPQLRRLVRSLCEWTRELMLQGAPLALHLSGRFGWELRLVVQGGLRILDKIAALDHATLLTRPVLARSDGPLLLWRACRMGRDMERRMPGMTAL